MTSAAKSRKGSVMGWVVFLATLLTLSFAAMPAFDRYSVLADRVLVSVRLSLVLALSLLVVRERFSDVERRHGTESILQRCRRWFYDE